jgi:hypothetical protein|tara:strand:- start:182 stop:436 length:255 start_codon:yes stop_codon:yes gene_type:complete
MDSRLKKHPFGFYKENYLDEEFEFINNKRLNYINNPALENFAYKDKFQLTSLVSKNKIRNILEFRRALLKIGSRRNITMLAKKK